MASTQVSNRPTLEILFSCNGKSSDVLRQTEEFAAGSYVELRTCEVPCGWTNHPVALEVNISFKSKAKNIKARLKADHNIPNARPVLSNTADLFLIEGGDGKYYLWNDISDYVARIEECNLQEILGKLGSQGLSGLELTLLTE